MDNTFVNLQDIERLLKQFIADNKRQSVELLHSKEEMEMMKKLLRERNEKIEILENQLSVLKLAKTFNNENESASGDRVELKKKINELIKEIDNCVALLNN